MLEIYANKNKDSDSFNFKGLDNNFKKVLSICSKCKYFDDETDFPNCFCNKSCDMIDYWFNCPKCSLNKFILVDKKESR